MSDIKFDNSSNEFANVSTQQKESFDVTKFLIRLGIVKDAQQATYFLLGLAALMLVVAFFIFHHSASSRSIAPVDMEEMSQTRTGR